MSIDQRHTQIKEKAGLEESRLNQDFIEFLKKWGTPLLGVVAAVSVGYVGLDYLKQRRVATIDAAFQEYQVATSFGVLNANPDALVNIATTFTDANAIPVMAKLGAADAYLQAVRTGLRPGAVLGQTGEPESPDDVLGDSDRVSYLDRAAALYRDVLQSTSGKRGQEIHAISALFGLSAVAESNGDASGARGHLEQVIAVAEPIGFVLHVKIAQGRIEALGRDPSIQPLIPRSELPTTTSEPTGGLDLFPELGLPDGLPGGQPEAPPEQSDDAPASQGADATEEQDAPPTGDRDEDPG